ncbi:unnamed protein product, partial [Urochloa humidicola]
PLHFAAAASAPRRRRLALQQAAAFSLTLPDPFSSAPLKSLKAAASSRAARSLPHPVTRSPFQSKSLTVLMDVRRRLLPVSVDAEEGQR